LIYHILSQKGEGNQIRSGWDGEYHPLLLYIGCRNEQERRGRAGKWNGDKRGEVEDVWNGMSLAFWLRVWEVMALAIQEGSVSKKGDSQALGPYCYLWMKTVSAEVESRTLYSRITDIVGLDGRSLCRCTTLVSVHLIESSTTLWIASISQY
jgi:hypothetical protein